MADAAAPAPSVDGASLSPAQSRRNVLVAAATSFTGFAGFTLVMPFLPLYISELGVSDVGEIAFWSGLTLGATPAVTAISAPLWGRVGDRYGSKILVVRSLVAFSLTKAAMAFVTAPWQLVALRGLLGVFAGYGALTMSMAARVGAARRNAEGDWPRADGTAAGSGARPDPRRRARAARRSAARVPRHRGRVPGRPAR